ncbi:MAG: phospholipid carrier-dependent glycosyltransferase [Chloroflexi bacterium]|nr:phospholipid carrier-dependent glycosyltransferase [Chloroflexota bacterium]OJV91328.1 MAG: hypothetical protein BGO39_27175 [Chloroflexi bacterium 54-19]
MLQENLTVSEIKARTEEENRANFLLTVRRNYVPILLGLIILLAFSLRIYDITGNPPGLNQDEAVNGVDAYSLGQTLRDHHGNFLPALLESFEDWASSLLTYLTVPFVWVLGLSEFSVRLPVVLLGTASVPLMFLYVRKLTGQTNLGLLASFLLGIMPWNIMASRFAIPPHSLVFFLLLLLYVNVRVGPTEKKLWKFGAIGALAALVTYSYSTQKMFIPLLLGVFFIADIFNNIPPKLFIKKYLVIGGTFLALTSPIYLLTLIDPGKYNARFTAVSIFSQYQNPTIEILTRYLNYFNPIRIFDGPNTFIFLVIFHYLGIAGCIFRVIYREPFFNILNKSQAVLLLGWWLVTPVAASLTIDPYISSRVIHGFPLVIIFSVLGFAIVCDPLKTRFKKFPKFELTFYLIVVAFSVYFLVVFYSTYSNLYKTSTRATYQYGVPQFSQFLVQHKTEFDTVTVDSHINQPYIYYLFYSKEDPHQYNYSEITFPQNGQDNIRGIPRLDNYIYAKVDPETVAGADELLTVKDEDGTAWYKVFAKDRHWYVQMLNKTDYEPPY